MNERVETLLVFLVTWVIVSSVFFLVLTDQVPEKTLVSIFLGLFSGFIVCGGGKFVWEFKTGD